MPAIDLRIGSLCSGIGGLELGLERAGLGRTVWQVEIDEAARRVLARHWPGARRWDDLRTFPGWEADLICAGFPCQPFSEAGSRLGTKDPRWLWPAVARTVRVVRPEYVVLENVPPILDGPAGIVLGDLAALGYDAEWDCLPAEAVGAPHERDRWFLLAYANGSGLQGAGAGIPDGRPGPADCRPPAIPHANGKGLVLEEDQRTGWPVPARRGGWPPEPPVGRVAYGVPGWVDSLKQLGNAVLPQVAEAVGMILRARIEARCNLGAGK